MKVSFISLFSVLVSCCIVNICIVMMLSKKPIPAGVNDPTIHPALVSKREMLTMINGDANPPRTTRPAREASISIKGNPDIRVTVIGNVKAGDGCPTCSITIKGADAK